MAITGNPSISALLATATEMLVDPINLLPQGKLAAGVGILKHSDIVQKLPEFSKSIIKEPLYHGTSADKDFGSSFRKSQKGNFVSPDSGVASAYSLDNDSMKLVYEGGKFIPRNTSSRVIPVYANIQNPYKLTAEEIDKYKKVENYAKYQKDMMQKAKMDGYDAIIYPDGAISVADPKQLVSALVGK